MKKKALLVGINRYQLPGSDLSGCVNDVANVQDLLIRQFAFEPPGMRLLVDEQATREGILRGLQWLVGGICANDRILFHFSGHGSQVPDSDGDEARDHMDEILCPHDMDWGGTFIVDDELRVIFSGLAPGVVLEVWLDCCHSGTGTRVAVAQEAIPRGSSVRSRFLYPPAHLQARMDEDLEVRQILRRPLPIGHVLWAGCRDDQASADAFIDGDHNGAFTFHLCKALREAGGHLSRGDLLKRLRAALRSGGFDQVPQLECPRPARNRGILE